MGGCDACNWIIRFGKYSTLISPLIIISKNESQKIYVFDLKFRPIINFLWTSFVTDRELIFVWNFSLFSNAQHNKRLRANTPCHARTASIKHFDSSNSNCKSR
jgi:hypothetical protein